MNKLEKNTQVGKVKLILSLFYFFLISVLNPVIALENIEENFIEIKILDKVSSKTNLLKLKIGEGKKFQNLLGFMVLIFETYFCAALDNFTFCCFLGLPAW